MIVHDYDICEVYCGEPRGQHLCMWCAAVMSDSSGVLLSGI